MNASNIEKDWAWILDHADSSVGVRDTSDETGLLALQGPASAAILAGVNSPNAGALRLYHAHEFRLLGRRSGYYSDGEDALVLGRQL